MPNRSVEKRIEMGELNLEAIAVEFKSGTVSISEITKKHKISRTSLVNLAKTMGWERQALEKSVRSATKKRVLREAAIRAGYKNPTDQQVVDANARLAAEIDSQHKEFSSEIITQTGKIAVAIESETDEKALNLLVKKAQGLHYLALPRIKAMTFQRQAMGLDESQATTLQVNLGLDSPVFAGLNLRAPTTKITTPDDAEGRK